MKFPGGLFGGKQSASPNDKPSILRLADPAHPAHEQLEQAAAVVDRCVQIELLGDRTAMRVSASAGDMERVISILDDAVAICPEDMDLLVAKACVLYAFGQFQSAEETLDRVLDKSSGHFEAKTWKNHWETWINALRYPKWNEGESRIHPAMAAHLSHNQRVQIVRDGLQKALAIVTGVQGPPFDSRTQIKVEWVLSKTPYGPLAAYYVKLIEPVGEPSVMEAFLPIFRPTLFSPMEGYFLVQQLAFTPYYYVVLASDGTASLNRKIIPGEKGVQNIRDIASQLASTDSYLPQQQFQSAMQWHMNNFDMDRLVYE